jgi:acetyl esterase
MSMTRTQAPIVLEPASQAFVEATAKPPFLYELTPDEARAVLDDVQAAPIDKLPVDEEWITIPSDFGDVRVRIVRPVDSSATLPVIVYMHGGGWILGNAATHDRLVRELAVGARAALLFVEYPNSPEARYPVAIEQGYAAAQWVANKGARNGLDARRMAVAGESVGGNMAAALTLMAKQRGDVTFVQTSMYYPVTDAAMDTASYDEFAEGYYLTRKAMEWFWDAYTPDPDPAREDHRLIQPGHPRAARGPAPHGAAGRRSRRATRRRRGLRRQAARGRRSDHDRALRRRHPRLHAA